MLRNRPVLLMAIGLVLVAIDLRINALDIASDSLGWLLVALGAWKLSLRPAAAVAVATAVLALPDLVLPYHWQPVNAITGEPVPKVEGAGGPPEHLWFDPLTGWRLAVAALVMIGAGITLWLLLGGLARRASTYGAPAAARLRIARPIVLAAWVVPYLVLVALAVGDDDGFDPVWNGSTELVAIAGLTALGALIVVLWLHSDQRWSVPNQTDAREMRLLS